MSEGKAAVEEYVLVEVFTGEIVKRFDNPKKANTWGRMQSVYRLDFSDFKTEGTYVLRVGETMSPRFVIGNRIYDETADFILRYMRQQRCGFNPIRTGQLPYSRWIYRLSPDEKWRTNRRSGWLA